MIFLKKLTKEFATSLLTVILAILAIALYISSGGTILFYFAVALAIVVGFYNAWLISGPGTANVLGKRKGSRRN